MIALAFNGANLYGYVKCAFGANKDLNSAAGDFVKEQIFKNALDIITKPSSSSSSSSNIPQPPNVRPSGIV